MKHPSLIVGAITAVAVIGAIGRAPAAAQKQQIQGSNAFPVEEPSDDEIAEILGAYIGFPVAGKSQTPAPPPPPACPPGTAPCPSGGAASPTQDEDVIPIHGDASGKVDEIMAPDQDDERPMASGPSVDPFDGLARVGPPRSAGVAPLVSPATIVVRLPDGTMEMRVYSRGGLSAQERASLLQARGALVPLSTEATRGVEEWIAAVAPRGSGVHLTRVALRGYCVESKKRAPASGAMYIWGPPAVQEQFAPMRSVRAVAEFAASAGYLKPQGDPAEYGLFITQYAIWTKLEHWDRARFIDEFVRRSKDAFKSERRPWTADTEHTLRALAPGRWHDVQLVIRAADGVEQRSRQSRGGAR